MQVTDLGVATVIYVGNEKRVVRQFQVEVDDIAKLARDDQGHVVKVAHKRVKKEGADLGEFVVDGWELDRSDRARVDKPHFEIFNNRKSVARNAKVGDYFVVKSPEGTWIAEVYDVSSWGILYAEII